MPTRFSFAFLVLIFPFVQKKMIEKHDLILMHRFSPWAGDKRQRRQIVSIVI